MSGKLSTARRVSLVLALGTFVMAIVALVLPGPWDSDLRILLAVLGGLAALVATALAIGGLLPVSRHPLVAQLARAPEDIVRIDVTHVHRNGVHIRTALDFIRTDGSRFSVEVDPPTAKKWHDLLVERLPGLVSAASA